MTEPTPVLLVDLSSIAHPIWHVSQSEPDPDHTSQRTAAVVRQLASDHPHAAICCDAPGSFRKELDATYKANRPPAEAALHHQIDLAREALEADGFPVWRVDGFEGDDLIATATKQLTEVEFTGHSFEPVPVLIASADKDLLSLVSDRVEVHRTTTGKRIGPAEVREKLGVDPCQVVDYLTLVGDASDNIKGAKGIGPKTAVGLLRIFGNIDDCYRAIDDGTAGLTPGQNASLKELRPRLEGVRALVTMRTDVPLDVSQVFNERVPKVAEAFMEGEPMGDRNEPTTVDLPTHTPWEDEQLGKLKPDPPPAPPPKETVETVALVADVVESAPDEWERGLEPRCMDDAVRLAQRMHDSRMFSAYGLPQAVLSTILLGRELGMPAMASLRSVHTIKGKHCLSADLMVALVLKSGLADYFRMVESTDALSTFETQRKGDPEPTSITYTIEQAQQADLVKPNSNWMKYRPQMLRARAKSDLARLVYPDLLAGLYTPDEMGDAKVEVA